ncbi:MAG: FAD-dependent monooxygenase, partial [bacterium]|nr:FAD-dependent monooxygenase [bacterium]
KMEGTYGLSRHYNTIFRSPGLRDAQAHDSAVMIWQINPDGPSILGPMDVDDLWYFAPASVPEGMTYTADEMADLIRKSMGLDVPIEILSSDLWVASTLIADHYSEGRVFLIGDACHLHPPFGGYGMNMGIGDAVDLGWKLAAVLQDWGGPGLLKSYEAERRPTHEFVIAEAAANHSVLPHQLLRPEMENLTPEGEAIRAGMAGIIQKTKRNEFHSLGVSLGYRYQASPVIAYEDDDNWTWSRDYEPSATPGSRAPHRWLSPGRSLYDLFGPGFTLLVLNEAGRADAAEAQAEAQTLGVPLTIVALEDQGLESLYHAPLALVRPDQHIAWRGRRWRNGVLSLATGAGASQTGDGASA